jgi:hypothetical protein
MRKRAHYLDRSAVSAERKNRIVIMTVFGGELRAVPRSQSSHYLKRHARFIESVRRSLHHPRTASRRRIHDQQNALESRSRHFSFPLRNLEGID